MTAIIHVITHDLIKLTIYNLDLPYQPGWSVDVGATLHIHDCQVGRIDMLCDLCTGGDAKWNDAIPVEGSREWLMIRDTILRLPELRTVLERMRAAAC